jgi:PAS domain S-box-containing protein
LHKTLGIGELASPGSRPAGLISVDSPEAQAASITSPEAFEALFEEAPHLLCIRNLRGKLVRLNPAWSTLLGFSLRELQGMTLLDLVHPEDVWATHDIMHRVSEELMVLGFSNRYRLAGGGHRRFEWTARRFGDQVFGIGRATLGR